MRSEAELAYQEEEEEEEEDEGGRPCLVGVQYSAAPGHQAQLSCFLFSVCRPIRIGNQEGKGKQEAQGKAAAAARSLLAEKQQK